MKKIIILLTFVLLITGCSADYTLYMKEDMSFEENFIMQDENAHFLELGKNIKSVIKTRQDAVIEMLQLPNIDMDSFKGKEKSGIKANQIYLNYEELNESIFFKNVNAKAALTKEGALTTLYIFNNFDYLFYLEETEYDPIALKNIQIHIDIPFLVTETNADSVDGSIYTWNIDSSITNRTYYVKFDESKIVRKKKWDDKVLAAIVIGALLVAFGIFGLIAWYINKKNNEM